MTPDQKRAAASLKRALGKVRDADLRLLVYSGTVYTCPTDIDPQANNDGSTLEILEEHGMDCTPIGLNADGGAGV